MFFVFFFWLQLFCLFIMASRWQTSAYNNRRKGWRGSLFEKTANEVSAANNIGRLPKKHLMLFSKFVVLVDWEIIMCLIKLVDPFEARNNCHYVKTFLVWAFTKGRGI